jgi:hypothetical protein
MFGLLVNHPFYNGLKDFTFHVDVDAETLKNTFGSNPPDVKKKRKSKFQDDVEATLTWDPNRPIAWPPGFDAASCARAVGRLNISSCFGGRYLSCTFRTPDKPKGGLSATEYRIEWRGDAAGYAPDLNSSAGCLNTIETICEAIYGFTLKEPHPAGLFVIAGATNSGKSNIGRGLIHQYLKNEVEALQGKTGRRRPHLITFEDPVERYWFQNPEKAKETGIDYTPREKGTDAPSLKEAITAALRQTPSVFYAGETRDPEDWKELLRFASTGHLCVTTSHAASLTEAMGQMLRAVGANSPARRSDVGRSVLAIVHLRSERISCGDKPEENEEKCKEFHECSVLLPAIWVRSDAAAMTLMSDGLTSILPFRDSEKLGDTGCLGRTAFAEILLNGSSAPSAQCDRFKAALKNKAREWDLEGI